MKTMLVIGLGRFGSHHAKKLAELGCEVMAVDKSDEKVSAVAPFVTASQIGDCQNENVIHSLGIDNYDVCFVCVSDDFQSSLEITYLLKEAGAKYIVSKTDRIKQAKFLRIIGANDVVHAETDMAQRLAVKYSAKNAFDYIELTPEYAIFEIVAPSDWVGKTVSEVNVRNKYDVNIIGVKHGDDIEPLIQASHVFERDEHLIIAGSKKNSIRVMGKA